MMQPVEVSLHLQLLLAGIIFSVLVLTTHISLLHSNLLHIQ